MIRGTGAQRVQASEKMTDIPVPIDERFHAGLKENLNLICFYRFLPEVWRCAWRQVQTLERKTASPGALRADLASTVCIGCR